MLTVPVRKQLYDHYMTDANRWVEKLKNDAPATLETLEGDLGEIQFFALPTSEKERLQ